MSGTNALSFWAVLYELNRKEMIKKLALFPGNLHHYVTIANSIIGAEDSSIGEVMGRYADIVVTLQKNFDVDYGRVLQKLVSINMLFCEEEAKHAQTGA